MEDEEDDAPGTAAGIAAAFQRGRSFAMSESDVKEAEMESKKFRRSGKKVSTKKSGRKKKTEDVVEDPKPSTLSKAEKKKKKDVDPYKDALELVGQNDSLFPEYRYDRTNQNGDHLYTENQATNPGLLVMEVDLADSDKDLSQETKPQKGINESWKTPQVTVIDDEDDDVEIMDLNDSQDSQSELGQMVPFYISLNGERFSLMVYENIFIDEVRKKVADKSGNPDPEFLQMFLGNIILDDKNTVKESGITDCCTIDVFFKQKSEQELYEEGSSSIIKLKMQTSDRRGRQNCFIYVKKTATMRVVRDKYASEIGVNPADMKLESDGEFVSLDSTPEECELENEFVIDVTILAAGQENTE